MTSRPFLRLALLAALAASAGARADVPTPVYQFGGGPVGAYPHASPVIGADGAFYGTAYDGGPFANAGEEGYGLVYRVNADGSGYTVLHAFDNQSGGGNPWAGLLAAADGSFYGSTIAGDAAGPAPLGAIYRVTAAGDFSVVHTFTRANDHVNARLVQDAGGLIYGTSVGGGRHNAGYVFRMRPDGGDYTDLFDFDGQLAGSYPQGQLTLGKDGRLYGVTSDAGANFGGIVWSLARDGTGFTVLHAFAPIVHEGSLPMSGVVEHEGWFYGTTADGGQYACGCGTIYRVNAAKQFETLRSFDGPTLGAGGFVAPTFSADGNLFVPTAQAGPNGWRGTVVELDRRFKVAGVQPLDDTGYALGEAFTVGADGQFYAAASSNPDGSGNGALVRFDPTRPLPVPERPLPTITSFATGVSRLALGKDTPIYWSSDNAGSCQSSGDWSGGRRTSGVVILRPQAAGMFHYTLTCRNPSGAATSTIELKVYAPR